MFHYTNDRGYKAISSQQPWLFKASKPPCNHPRELTSRTSPGNEKSGQATLRPRLRGQNEFRVLLFGDEDLRSIEGGRGEHIFYSREDYPVVKERQGPHGETVEVQKELA